MNPNSMTNERLCTLAQKGDARAADLLLEHNSGFIRKTASEIFLKSNLAESDLSIEPGDLEQEGCIGLLKAISSYDKGLFPSVCFRIIGLPSSQQSIGIAAFRGELHPVCFFLGELQRGCFSFR